MAGSGTSASRQPRSPGQDTPRKLPQVLMIRKDESTAAAAAAPGSPPAAISDPVVPAQGPAPATSHAPATPASQAQPQPGGASPAASSDDLFDLGALEGMSMADLLGPQDEGRRRPGGATGSARSIGARHVQASATPAAARTPARSVDDFDFDEEAFLAALDEQDFVGSTGEVVNGTVIGVESDGIYVDIGGKAPGFMPKKECGLGVITNLKERFPKGEQVEVLVTREQNADGMVTVSARALALRQSWDKVQAMEKDGKVVQVKISGFNRGGVTCDLEGLRGFIPRSQLNEGEKHESLVGRTIGVTFLEVNPDSRKLVLSEKRAATAARFQELEVGQLVEGQVAALKPYGFFIDLGGVSGLLHHSSISGAVLRDLREVFQPGERIRALITDLDPGRGRIALNTALLEGQPGELLIAKEKVMAEAADRANRARSLLRQQEQSAG